MSLGHLVDIQQDFFFGLHTSLLPAVNRIFLSFFEAGIDVVTFSFYGNGYICLLNSSNDLVVKFFLKFFGMLHDRVFVLILSL